MATIAATAASRTGASRSSSALTTTGTDSLALSATSRRSISSLMSRNADSRTRRVSSRALQFLCRHAGDSAPRMASGRRAVVHQREHQAPPRVPDDGLLVAEAVERAREEARDVRAERLRLGRDREGRGAERAGAHLRVAVLQRFADGVGQARRVRAVGDARPLEKRLSEGAGGRGRGAWGSATRAEREGGRRGTGGGRDAEAVAGAPGGASTTGMACRFETRARRGGGRAETRLEVVHRGHARFNLGRREAREEVVHLGHRARPEPSPRRRRRAARTRGARVVLPTIPVYPPRPRRLPRGPARGPRRGARPCSERSLASIPSARSACVDVGARAPSFAPRATTARDPRGRRAVPPSDGSVRATERTGRRAV